MRTHPLEDMAARGTRRPPPPRGAAALLLAALLAGCGPVREADSGSLARQSHALTDSNGLTVNGLATEAFSHWFSGNPTLHALVMRYMVRCALGDGHSLTYMPPGATSSYTWSGGLGLAPGWTGGAPATELEQQLMSACLAAHANLYGQNMSLSLLGRDARLNALPYTSTELQTYSRRESCFFGNLFTGEGIFAGADRNYLQSAESSLRACGLIHGPGTAPAGCSPLVHIGSCEASCTLDASGLYYTSCTAGGRAYLPLTTRLRPSDVFLCGDGICQSTERCTTTSGEACESPSCRDCAEGEGD